MKCAIKKCISNASNIEENEKQNISYYRFPSDREKFQKCLETITKNNSLNELHPPLFEGSADNDNIMYLCSLHFHKDFNGKIFEPVDERFSSLSERSSNDLNVIRIHNKEGEPDTQHEISKLKIECDLFVNEYDSINIATKYDLHNTCRTCRSQNVSLENIFKDLNENSHSSFIIANELRYLKLNISDDDQLPQKICIKCVNHLSKINSFRIECERSQAILDNYIKNKIKIDKSLKQEMSNGKTINMKSHSEFEFININENANDNQDSNTKENVAIVVESPIGNVNINNTNLLHENDNSNENAEDDNNSIISNIIVESEHDNESTNSINKTTLKTRKSAKKTINQQKKIKSKLSCAKCGKRFKHIGSFEWHTTNVKCDEIKKLCVLCNEKFTTKIGLKRHLKETHPHQLNRYSCSMCDKTFMNAENFAFHTKTHDTDNALKCYICDRVYPTANNFIRHIRRVHSISNHTCPHCSMQFDRTRAYLYHLKSHNPNKPFKCKYCDRSFLQPHHLQDHETSHTGARPYLCNICGNDYPSYSSLTIHVLYHTRPSERPFKCSVCERGFISRTHLRYHMRSHTDERPYKCDLCDKGFKSKPCIVVHMRTHAGASLKSRSVNKISQQSQSTKSKLKSTIPTIGRYACDLCHKSFEIASSLTSHMKTHSEDRKYKCTLCPSAFKQPSHLRSHINGVHLKQKPYKCEKCDKSFLHNGHRTVHMRIHTGEMPFKCQYCDKQFRDPKHMRGHMRYHTGEKPYKCELCASSFASWSGLSWHTKKFHSVSV